MVFLREMAGSSSQVMSSKQVLASPVRQADMAMLTQTAVFQLTRHADLQMEPKCICRATDIWHSNSMGQRRQGPASQEFFLYMLCKKI